MGEIIREWLRTRLGVIIDPSPEIFGHYARDGTLLGKVLHSYDVINDSQLSTLLVTQDPALARLNLKHLRSWLKFVGVECENDCIEDISNGKGTMALRLFYKVFLCLENKDRLHFVTLRKEREKYIPSSSKFDVTRVPEDEAEREDSSLRIYADALIKSKNLIDWQREKYAELMKGYKKNRDKFPFLQRVVEKEEIEAEEEDDERLSKISGVSGRRKPGKGTSGRSLGSLEMRQLDEFSRQHRAGRESTTATTARPEKSITPRPDEEAARAYTESLKSRRRREAMAKNFKSRVQKNLLSDLWNEVLIDQEQEFDAIIAKKVLHQTEYEKQLVRKLCEVRNEKTRMAGNRRIVEKLLEETREAEARLEQDRAREVTFRETEEVEAEARRIAELERKIEQQSRERRTERKRRYIEKTVIDLVDMATRAAEYNAAGDKRGSTDRLPESLWNQWKALFLKNQPIAETESRAIERYDGGEEEADENQMVTDAERDEDEARTRILNEEDFDKYHTVGTQPWKDFLPEPKDESVEKYLNLGLVVLGRIVHKCLEASRIREEPLVEPPPPLPFVRTKAVLLGVPDSDLYQPIQRLLTATKIRLVRVEDAINDCLERYKEEMRDHEYVDLEITGVRSMERSVAATRSSMGSSEESVVRSGPSGKRKTARKKSEGETRGASKLKNKGEPEAAERRQGLEKATQTPRVIPHEDADPRLSNAAYTGKWIHEFLSLGEPLSDDLVSRTILEYIRGFDDTEGFVIVDYPKTRSQMYALEFALTGRRLPLEREELSNPGVDEIEPITPSRIEFRWGQEEGFGEEDSWQESRLVPNPTERSPASGRTCLTSFVRIKPMPETREIGVSDEKKDDDDIWEIVREEDATSVDAFYIDQEIAFVLYYRIFDARTLKNLARLVIAGAANDPLARVPSRELFGEFSHDFEERTELEYTMAPASCLIKRPLRRSSPSDETQSYESFFLESRHSRVSRVSEIVRESREPQPGEDEWPWADRYFEPPDFPLGDLWRNLENRYLESLKEAFHLRRACLEEFTAYEDITKKRMEEYIDRPDQRQDFLHEFHRAFNDIARDIREDRAVKEELHRRIEDFETKLWEMCDSRRREAERERRRLIEDESTSRRPIDLTNIYADITRIEFERSRDTLRFIQDYYASLMRRPFREIPSELKPSSSIRAYETVTNNPNTPPPNTPNVLLVEAEMEKLLAEENFVPGESLCFRTLEAVIREVRSILESLGSRVLESLDKEENAAGGGSKKPENDESRLLKNLFREWRCALEFEINRIRDRLKIIEGAGRSDLDGLIGGTWRLFSDVLKRLTDRYERESRSVSEVASVFRLATEHGIPVQKETLLEGDRFLVRSNVLLFPDQEDSTSRLVPEEELHPTRFTVSQLSRLADTFARVAPGGRLPERSFLYILQDLISLEEDRGCANAALPSSWYELRVRDVTRLLDEYLGRVDFVDWREFLVCAMDLEPPSLSQILSNFRAFRRLDREAREYVERDKFFSIGLWFSPGNADQDSSFLNRSIDADPTSKDTSERFRLLEELLCWLFSYEDQQRVNYVALLLAFCKDDVPEIGLAKALSLTIDGRVCTHWENDEEYPRLVGDNLAPAGRDSNVHREALEVCESMLKLVLDRVVGSARGASRLPDSLRTVTSLHADREDNATGSGIQFKDRDESLSDYSLGTEKRSGLSREGFLSGRFEESIESGWYGSLVEKTESTEDSRREECVYWLDVKVPQVVLAAMLPDEASRANILGTGLSLRENLELVCQEIRDECGCGDDEAIVPVHRFLRHDFVKKLLEETKKFKRKRLGSIVGGIVRENDAMRYTRTNVNMSYNNESSSSREALLRA